MEPVILAPGEGEALSDKPTQRVVIKAGLDEVAATESRYGAGVSGPGPHVHREHADCFLVLEGQLVFELGPEPRERRELGAGGFVLVPPMVVHTFRNEGPGDARFLNLHAPGMGFEQHLRELYAAGDDDAAKQAAIERWDTWDPPADGGRPASDAIVRAPGEGQELRLGPSRSLVRASFGDDAGWLTLAEVELAAGYHGEPAHRHGATVDSFLVLAGELTLRIGDEQVALPAGAWASVPPGVVHAFSNPSSSAVRFANVLAPTDPEDHFAV